MIDGCAIISPLFAWVLGSSRPWSQLSLDFSREKQQQMFMNSSACMGSHAEWRQTLLLSQIISIQQEQKSQINGTDYSFLRWFLFWFLPLGTEIISINILLLIIHHYKHGTFSVFTIDLSLSSVLHLLLPLLGISFPLLCLLDLYAS